MGDWVVMSKSRLMEKRFLSPSLVTRDKNIPQKNFGTMPCKPTFSKPGENSFKGQPPTT